MKFQSLSLLTCSLIIQSSAVSNPYLQSNGLAASGNDDFMKCFLKCGEKDPDDADKIQDCQIECVEESIDNGFARSAIGPRGADNLLLCGSDCADEAEDEFDKEKRDFKRDIKDEFDEKGCIKKCDEEDESCVKKCDEEAKDIKKKLKDEAEDEAKDEAEKAYERCARRCFEPDVFNARLRGNAFQATTDSALEEFVEEGRRSCQPRGQICIINFNCCSGLRCIKEGSNYNGYCG